MSNPSKTKLAEGMDAFFTADRASEGIRVDLKDPLGRPTAHWLHIIGTDSEEFRLIDSEMRRRLVAIQQLEDFTERDRASLEITRSMTARLVKAWSFDLECTEANVIEFFKKAPQVQNMVDASAATRRLFYKVESEPSSDSSNTNSVST